MEQEVSPAFVTSLQAALGYWQERLESAGPRELDAERHNLYRAVQFGLNHAETQALAAEVATGAFSFVFARGYWQEWLRVMERAAGVAERLPTVSRFWLLTRLGNLRRLNRDLGGALHAHREALEVAQETGEPLLMAEAHYHLGRAMRGARRYDEAQEQLRSARQLLEHHEDQTTERLSAQINNALGRVAHDRGDLDDARRFLEVAVAHAREFGDPSVLADQLHDLGNVYRAASDYEEALTCYNEALTLFDGRGRWLHHVQITYNVAVLHFVRMAYAEAETIFRQIDLPFLRETGNFHHQALIVTSLGNCLLYQERYEEATEMLREGVALWRQLQDSEELANAVGSLGEALAGLGKKEEARAMFTEALALLSRSPWTARAERLRKLFTAEREKVAR